jgi:hypothetical protein
MRETELARRFPGGLDLRPDPLRVRWEFPDLVAADGHELRCTFTASVRAIPDRTERLALEEVLLAGRNSVFADDVAQHFYASLRAAAARVAQGHEGKEWMEGNGARQELVDALKAAAAAVAFACGLEVLPPLQVDLQSPTYERVRVAALQQALVEKEAAGQVERMARTAELLKQFQALRSSAPELSAGQVLERVSSGDRGSLMQAMLMAGSREKSAGALWAVAGPYLVRVETGRPVDPNAPPASKLIPLPPTLGPLRSVQAEVINDRQMLLVGAQRGFLLVSEDDPNDVRAFADAQIESALGFNRVIYWPQQGQFCATHSEAGLVCWDADAPSAAARALRPAELGILPSPYPQPAPMMSMSMSMRSGGAGGGPRNLRQLDSRTLAFSAGGAVLSWDGKSAKTISELNRSEVVFMRVDQGVIQSVHEDGTIHLSDASGKLILPERHFGRVRSAGVLPWMGASRLLLGPDDGPMQCIGFDDPVVTQYFSSYRGLRAIAGSAALVAAVDPGRQRVVLWNSWDGRQPAAELFIGAQARHRIADIAFS